VLFVLFAPLLALTACFLTLVLLLHRWKVKETVDPRVMTRLLRIRNLLESAIKYYGWVAMLVTLLLGTLRLLMK